VVLVPLTPGRRYAVSAEDLTAALEEGARQWNGALRGCKAPELRVGGAVSAGAARTDGRNLVVVLGERWCPADRASDVTCYDPSKQAITHVRQREHGAAPAGEIDEVDIEINAVDYRWSLTGDAVGTRNLRALVLHELGHALGLADSCSAMPLVAPAPEGAHACTETTRRSVMYPDPTEIGRVPVLQPTADAIIALCRPKSQTVFGCSLSSPQRSAE
jgi:hypothetical protein